MSPPNPFRSAWMRLHDDAERLAATPGPIRLVVDGEPHLMIEDEYAAELLR